MTDIPSDRPETRRTVVRDVLLGGTLLTWAARDAVRPETWESSVRLGTVLLNLLVGGLILARRPARREGSTAAVLASLPSLAVGFAAAALAPGPAEWPTQAIVTFLAGVTLVLAAFSTLGRSFAILPSVRRIATGGPYRFVRHPAYTGQLLLLLACHLAGPTWWTVLPLAAALPALALRIRYEERLLATSEEYAAYASRVRWRLVPAVW